MPDFNCVKLHSIFLKQLITEKENCCSEDRKNPNVFFLHQSPLIKTRNTFRAFADASKSHFAKPQKSATWSLEIGIEDDEESVPINKDDEAAVLIIEDSREAVPINKEEEEGDQIKNEKESVSINEEEEKAK
jgi:hypothetical protein